MDKQTTVDSYNVTLLSCEKIPVLIQEHYGRITKTFWVKVARHIRVPSVNSIIWITKQTELIYNDGNQISNCMEREVGVIWIENV